VDQIRITGGAGPPATLHALLVVVGLAVVFVLPALGYLYRLTQSPAWSAAEPGSPAWQNSFNLLIDGITPDKGAE
jgi:hypothetical protein